MLTLISSVPNIIVGKTAGIEFVDFFIKAAPYVVIATVITIWLGSKLFKIRALKTDEERASAKELVAGFDENEGIESPGFFRFGAIMTFVFIGTVAMTSQLPVINELGLSFVALAFAGVMLLRYKAVADRFYKAIDWDLLFFFVCLFAVISVMEHAQVLALIGEWLKPILGLGDTAGPASLLVASAAASSVTDNIPLAAMLAKILGGIPDIAARSGQSLLVGGYFRIQSWREHHADRFSFDLGFGHHYPQVRIEASFAGFVKVALPYALKSNWPWALVTSFWFRYCGEGVA